MKRRHLSRRKPWVEIREHYEESTDSFAVVAWVVSEHAGEAPVVPHGGFVKNWSTLTPEVQDKVRADLTAIAERDVADLRRHHRPSES